MIAIDQAVQACDQKSINFHQPFTNTTKKLSQLREQVH